MRRTWLAEQRSGLISNRKRDRCWRKEVMESLWGPRPHSPWKWQLQCLSKRWDTFEVIQIVVPVSTKLISVCVTNLGNWSRIREPMCRQTDRWVVTRNWTVQRGRVICNPASYSGCLGFKSRPEEGLLTASLNKWIYNKYLANGVQSMNSLDHH